jgi:hypothetical protein
MRAMGYCAAAHGHDSTELALITLSPMDCSPYSRRRIY